MFANFREEYTRDVARQDFERSHRQGIRHAFWSKLARQRYRLLEIQTIENNVQVTTRSHIGLQVVPMEQIVGSEGRSSDFDQAWRPLKAISQQRWTNIAMAHLKGCNLPAVDLIKVGDAYFVRDGHHRVSVAKFQGQLELEANVIAWHCAEMPENDLAVNHSSASVSNSDAISARARQFLTEVRYGLMTIMNRAMNKAHTYLSSSLSMTNA